MNGLAGAASVLASLYVAARVKGLGAPPEERPTAPQQAGKTLERTQTFLSMGRDFLRRGDFNAQVGDRDRAKTLLNAARAALSQAEAHIALLQNVPDRRAVAREIASMRGRLQELEKKL